MSNETYHYDHYYLKSLPLFSTSLELLENTTNTVSAGVVTLHSILTGNSMGLSGDHSENVSLGSRYPDIYRQFIYNRKRDFVLFLLEALSDSFSLSEEDEYNNNLNTLPVDSNLKKSILSLRNLNNMLDLDNLNSIELSLKAYIALGTYTHGNYIKGIDKIIDWCIRYFHRMDMDKLISITKIFTYLSNSKHEAYSMHYDTENIIRNLSSVVGSHKLLNTEYKITNEVLVCAGLNHIELLPFCTDKDVSSYTKEGMNYLVNVLYRLYRRPKSTTYQLRGKLQNGKYCSRKFR